MCCWTFFLLMLDEEDELTELDTQTPEPDHQPDDTATYFQLSPQALTSQFSPRTLKFKGVLEGLAVSVLVDTSSRHNILQPRIANHLHIPCQSIPNLSIIVGNGSHLHCAGFCSDIPITLENHVFHIPFYFFPFKVSMLFLAWSGYKHLGPYMLTSLFPKFPSVMNLLL
jgi:hypothetical protein